MATPRPTWAKITAICALCAVSISGAVTFAGYRSAAAATEQKVESVQASLDKHESQQSSDMREIRDTLKEMNTRLGRIEGKLDARR